MRILFIVKQRHSYHTDAQYGQYFQSGLYHSARFVTDMLQHNGYEVGLADVIDNNDIDRVVTEFNADVVVIEALWVTPSKFDILKSLHPNVKWIVRVHSEIPFLANENVAMGWIGEYLSKGIWVASNSERAFNDLKVLSHDQNVDSNKILLMPNYYDMTVSELRHVKSSVTLEVGCFGSIRPMKNQLTQALAAIKYANSKEMKLRFHINSTRVEMNGNGILQNIRDLFRSSPHELVEHEWLDHARFIDIVKCMDIGLQVSLSETFNIVTADFVANGVATVTSPEIEWTDECFHADPNSVDDIVKKIGRALWVDKWIPFWNSSKRKLKRYNANSIKEWKNALEQIQS